MRRKARFISTIVLRVVVLFSVIATTVYFLYRSEWYIAVLVPVSAWWIFDTIRFIRKDHQIWKESNKEKPGKEL